MKKENVLEIEITKINEEWSVFNISYQNEEVLRRGEFIDNELKIYSKERPNYNCEENSLYLRGFMSQWDLEVMLIENEYVENLREKVRLINDKYGIVKRWRAKTGEEYWQIKISFHVNLSIDIRSSFDDTLYKIGNYFQTKEEAEIYAEKFKKILKER